MSIDNEHILADSNLKSKKNSIDTAKKDPYPSQYVFCSYTIFGGTVGGALVGIGSAMIDILFSNGSSSIFITMIVIVLCIALGFIIGLVPAMLTAWLIIRRKIILNRLTDYLKIFAIGFIVTSLCFLVFITFFYLKSYFVAYLNAYFNRLSYPHFVVNTTDIIMALKMSWLIGLIGGISSVIVGKWRLPKLSASKRSI